MLPAYSKWLMLKMMDWERENMHRQSISDFARYLKVKQPSLSQWLAGDHYPQGENLKRVASKLGNEIYFLVGELPPELKETVDNIPPEKVTELLAQVSKLVQSIVSDVEQ